jgi:hypothetical protein
MLSEPVVDFGDQVVQISEKIDGTNARIIVLPPTTGHWGNWVIGSRENLLTCSRDWFLNPELGIVNELADVANELTVASKASDPVRVYFFEVYGGTVNGWKNYTRDKTAFGHRLFDVIEFSNELFRSMMVSSREDIASWRNRGGQPFVSWDKFLEISQETNLVRAPSVERRFPAEDMPTSLRDALDWMTELLPDGSEATLGPDAVGCAEGIVLKSHDRKVTAKMRFQDYENTLRRLAKERLRAGLVE